MLGEIGSASAEDIASYQDIINDNGLSEIHFYTFTEDVAQECWNAMRGLTDPAPMPSV
jgi:hypothetical protein